MTVPRLGPVRHRSLAPDLARGWMLLLIAVANVPLFAYGRAADPASWGPVDRLLVVARACLVDGRAYPLFALLFGIGLATVGRRATRAAGVGTAVRVLRRRGAWLAVIGLVHGLLLFSGDVVSAYGVCGVVLASAVVHRRRRGVVAALVGGTVLLVVGTGARFVELLTEPEGTAGPALLARAEAMVASVTLQWLFVIGPVAAGVLVGWRWPDLERLPARVLAGTAAGGSVVAVTGGLGGGLLEVRGDAPGLAPEIGLGLLWGVTGLAGAAAWLAGLVLVARAIRRRGGPGPVAAAVAACGARSLSCYLAQSVVWAGLLSSWTLGLGGRLPPAAAAALAAGTWALTVVAARMADRRGHRGPLEVLLRRLTYGRATRERV